MYVCKYCKESGLFQVVRVLRGQGDQWDNRARARGVTASFSLNGIGLMPEETADLYQENEELKVRFFPYCPPSLLAKRNTHGSYPVQSRVHLHTLITQDGETSTHHVRCMRMASALVANSYSTLNITKRSMQNIQRDVCDRKNSPCCYYH